MEEIKEIDVEIPENPPEIQESQENINYIVDNITITSSTAQQQCFPQQIHYVFNNLCSQGSNMYVAQQ